MGIYISLYGLQHKIYKKHTEIPNELIGILSQKTFDKARLYSLDKSTFNMVNDTISLICTFGFLFCNGLVLLWNFGGNFCKYLGYEGNEILQSAVTISILNVLTTITSLPSSIYYTFVLEQKHGFNNQVYSYDFL